MGMIKQAYAFFLKNEYTTLAVVLLLEAALCYVIIDRIAYTEIDWVAYMQEVDGFLGGELNYSNLRGDTGPLVYPAGFVYVFSLLRWLTDNGIDIVKVFYLVVIGLVIRLYQSGKATPLWALVPLVLSKRVHSIFILRLFNDCVAVMFGYLAVYLFTRRKWRVGCFLYSLAVSVKMNMLLYAPGVLLVLLMGCGLWETFVCLSICAGVQVILGFPFLVSYPVAYLKNSFDLGRVFVYKWTVNLKFLPEEVFTSKALSFVLLGCTVIAYILFARKWIAESEAPIMRNQKPSKSVLFDGPRKLTPHFVTLTIFTSNFIGIVFARTLHYQFYCWYFHTIPYLLWHTAIPTIGKVLILAGIEYSFNVFPATTFSSLVLQLCHFSLLFALWFSPVPAVVDQARVPSSSKPRKKE